MIFNVGFNAQRNLGGLTMNGIEDFATQNADETVSDAGQGSELRVIGDDVYLQIPKNSDVTPSIPLPTITKPWVHIRVPDATDKRASSLAGIFGGTRGRIPRSSSSCSPTSRRRFSAWEQRSSGDSKSTHYRLTFDAAKTGKLNQAMDACDDSNTAPKDTTPVDVWVDGQGPRCTTVSEKAPIPQPSDFAKSLPSGLPTDWPSDLPSGIPSDLPSGIPSSWPTDLPTDLPSSVPSGLFGPGSTITVSLTLQLYDPGTDVRATPPPAAQTQKVPFTPAMLKQQSASDCSSS